MIIVIVHHWSLPGKKDASIARIDGNGELMREMPGFIRRYRMSCAEDDSMLSTVTVWQSKAAYDGWIARKRAMPDDGPSPYSRFVNQIYTVESEHQLQSAQ